MNEQKMAEPLSDTTPTEAFAAEEAAESTDTLPSVSGGEAACAAAEETQVCGAEDASEEEPQLTVRYNHKNRTLSLTEAKELAQKGLKLDSMGDMLNDLSYLAAIEGKKPAELIKAYIEAGEALKRQELTEQYGEDSEAVEVLMEKYRSENKQKLASFREAEARAEAETEKNLNRRIAEDFKAMQADFPELSSYAALPDEVKRQAISGIPLKYAYLDYMHTQEKRVAAATAQQAQAASKSTGSLFSGEDISSPESALLRGLWR